MSEPASYKEERLQKQIDWHSQKARHNKYRFRLYQIITLIASAIIPIVNVANVNVANVGDFYIRVISSIIGSIVVVAPGITQLEKYQENWILYRTSLELLKKEKYFFENNIGEYSDPDENERKKILVQRVESIVSAETSKYFTIHQLQKNAQQQENEKENQK